MADDETEPRSAAAYPASPLARAADRHLKSMRVAVQFGLLAGRRAVSIKGTTQKSIETSLEPSYTALRAALRAVLPNTLRKVAAAGGKVAEADLNKRLKTLGDREGHPFYGNQHTEGGGRMDDDYVYHFTPKENAEAIVKVGFEPRTPPQGAWDDGSSEPRTYFSKDPNYHARIYKGVAKVMDPEGKRQMQLLRVKASKLQLHRDRDTQEYYVKSRVEPSDVEYTDLIPDTLRINELRTAKDRPIVGFSFNGIADAVVEWADRYAAELIKGIEETTRERIRDAVSEALNAGSLRDLYDEIVDGIGSDDRAELIARTEIMTASNEGQRLAWDQAADDGYLTGKEKVTWIATSDACDECEGLDGAERAMDGEYPEPGGDGPPLHPNCRCTEGITA